MLIPLFMKELALESLAIVQIDPFGQRSPVQEAVSEGHLDVMAILGKGK